MSTSTPTTDDRADLIVGTARITVSLIDLSKDNAAIELKTNLADFAGASLYVHGVGRLPVAHFRNLNKRYYVLRFGDTSSKLRRKLDKHLKSHETVIGPAMQYLLSHSKI